MSCDAYDDLWRPFFSLFETHWPDCPFQVYLGTDQKAWSSAAVVTLRSPAGSRDWTGRLIDYLRELPHANVILMLDDFFLRRRVDTATVSSCVDFAQKHDATQVRLIPHPAPTDRLAGSTLVGECARGSPYRVSTQAAVWSRTRLLELLHPGESIWDFEHNSNQRIDAQEHGFYAVWRAALPYQGILAHHVVEKGKWLPHEKWIFRRRAIGCDFSRRETLDVPQVCVYHAAQLTDRLLSVLPWSRKASVKRAIRRLAARLLPNRIARLGGGPPVHVERAPARSIEP